MTGSVRTLRRSVGISRMARFHWLKVVGSVRLGTLLLGATFSNALAIGILIFSTPRRLKQKNSPGARAFKSPNSIFDERNSGASDDHAVGSSWLPTKVR